MNYFIVAIIMVFSGLSAYADLDNKILIYGKIGSAFTKTHIKIIDQHQQSYYLEKSLFPKNFKFEKGASFSLEVSETTLDKAVKDK